MTRSSANDKREVEFKFRVDGPEAFDALTKASASRPGPVVTQRNRFFDTASRDLHRQKYTLRLREESGGFNLTAKGPDQQSADGTLTSRAEEEIALASAEAHAVLNGEKAPLNVLDQRADPRSRKLLDAIRAIVAGKHLEHVGMFENDRMRLPVTLSVGDETVPWSSRWIGPDFHSARFITRWKLNSKALMTRQSNGRFTVSSRLPTSRGERVQVRPSGFSMRHQGKLSNTTASDSGMRPTAPPRRRGMVVILDAQAPPEISNTAVLGAA